MREHSGAAWTMPQPLHLDPVALAVRDARQYIRNALAALDRAALEDAATLGVSELVTNALLHARTPLTVTVGVTRDGRVRIGVSDDSPVLPRQHHYRRTATTGRGLRLVESVSSAWGVDISEPVAGKTVWFEPAEAPAEDAGVDEWSGDIAELL
jgi:anti-sigma regulatory factor (Ser/Thr protein kinase)